MTVSKILRIAVPIVVAVAGGAAYYKVLSDDVRQQDSLGEIHEQGAKTWHNSLLAGRAAAAEAQRRALLEEQRVAAEKAQRAADRAEDERRFAEQRAERERLELAGRLREAIDKLKDGRYRYTGLPNSFRALVTEALEEGFLTSADANTLATNAAEFVWDAQTRRLWTQAQFAERQEEAAASAAAAQRRAVIDADTKQKLSQLPPEGPQPRK